MKVLPANMVVMVVRGMILAHTVPISILRVPATVNQDLKALIPRAPIEPDFLAACLRAQAGFILGQVSTAAHGTKRLDEQALRAIQVLTPPLDVQECFVERAATARGVHARTTAQLQNLDALFAALQQRAFAGEL